MEATLINAAGTLAFGGGGIVIVSYLAYLYGKVQLENHTESIQRICVTHETQVNRMCDSFEVALDRRDKDIHHLVSEIRFGKSGIINNNAG